jgi:hypothetical protein
MFRNNNCQNNGYLDPRTCSRCICPDGFSGTYCDQRDSTSNCGNIITNPTPYSPTQITIQNPSPTSTIPTQQYCVFLIQVIEIIFNIIDCLSSVAFTRKNSFSIRFNQYCQTFSL